MDDKFESSLIPKKPSIELLDDNQDDFVLISSDVSSIDADANYSLVSEEYGNRGDGGKDDTVEAASKPLTMEPLAAFEMIQSEHRLLKEELTTQNTLLREKLVEFTDNEKRNGEMVNSLKKDLESSALEISKLKGELDASFIEANGLKEQLGLTRAELTEKDQQVADLERQLKYFKECSEHADLLTAKLMEAEDVMKAQNATIQQMQKDGYVSVSQTPPAFSIDSTLVAEIKGKDETIKRLEGAIASLEAAMGTMNGERLKALDEAERMSRMNVDLQELVNSLQLQSETDKAEWAAIRVDLEQQIQILSDRVTAFENHYSGQSVQPQPGVAILSHRDSPNHGRPSSYIECPRCHLPMINAGPHPCPAIIDGLD